MEGFRNIADETLPSFLGHSLSSSTSVTFENVTVSSNPGLPVAASTVARSRAGCDNRLSDVCASYLEGKLSPPSGSPASSQLDPKAAGRFAISFHEDTDVATQVKDSHPAAVSLKESHSMYREQGQNVVEHSNHSQDTFLEVLPLERLEDLSTGICFLPDSKNDKVGPPEPSEKLIDSEISSDHLSNSLSSFLENEKLSSLASSEDDSTGNSRAHSPMIAVGSDDNSPNILAKVQIYEYNENTRKYAKAEALMTVTDPVHDIAFAPNLGRSFHILAVATKDVRIFTLKPLRKELTSSGGLTKFEIHIVAQFDNHNSQVWRVSWNITGTVLASSGDDGCVRLWKANYMDNWKCTGILKGNGSPVNGSSQQGIFNASLGSANTSLQNSLNGSSAGRKQS